MARQKIKILGKRRASEHKLKYDGNYVPSWFFKVTFSSAMRLEKQISKFRVIPKGTVL